MIQISQVRYYISYIASDIQAKSFSDLLNLKEYAWLFLKMGTNIGALLQHKIMGPIRVASY